MDFAEFHGNGRFSRKTANFTENVTAVKSWISLVPTDCQSVALQPPSAQRIDASPTYQNNKCVGLGTESDQRSTTGVLELTMIGLVSTAETTHIHTHTHIVSTAFHWYTWVGRPTLNYPSPLPWIINRVPVLETKKLFLRLFKAFSFNNSRPIQGLLPVDRSIAYNPTGTWEKTHRFEAFVNDIY